MKQEEMELFVFVVLGVGQCFLCFQILIVNHVSLGSI